MSEHRQCPVCQTDMVPVEMDLTVPSDLDEHIVVQYLCPNAWRHDEAEFRKIIGELNKELNRMERLQSRTDIQFTEQVSKSMQHSISGLKALIELFEAPYMNK